MKCLSFKTISEIGLYAGQDISPFHFLTFDMDWAHDDVIAFTLDILEEAGAKSTWFVTHDTPLLERMRMSPLVELAVHPNFNDLLLGTGDFNVRSSAETIIDTIMALVPEAKAVRSHSLTQNSRLLGLFQKKGLLYDCNDFIPYESGIQIRPGSTGAA